MFIFKRIKAVKKENERRARQHKIMEENNLDLVALYEIMDCENDTRDKLLYIEVANTKKRITDDEYMSSQREVMLMREKILKKYDITSEIMTELYLNVLETNDELY